MQKTIYFSDAATSGVAACIPLHTNSCLGEPEVVFTREHDEVNFALKICVIHVRDEEFKIPRRRRCWIRFTGAARVKQKVLGSGLGFRLTTATMTKTGAGVFLATSTNLGQFRPVQGYSGVVFE